MEGGKEEGERGGKEREEGGRCLGENPNMSLTRKMNSHNWSEQKTTEMLQIPAKQCKDVLGLDRERGETGWMQVWHCTEHLPRTHSPSPALAQALFLCTVSWCPPGASPSAPPLPLSPGPTSLQPPPKPHSSYVGSSCCLSPLIMAPSSHSRIHSPLPTYSPDSFLCQDLPSQFPPILF